MSATKQLELSRRSVSDRINGGIITASSDLSVTCSTVTPVERYNYRKGEKPRFQRDSRTHARVEIARSTLVKTDGADRDKERAKGRAILLSEAMIVNTSRGTPRGALAPFYGNRDVKVEAGLRDRITFGLSDLRYLARRKEFVRRSRFHYSASSEYVFLTTFQCDTCLNG